MVEENGAEKMYTITVECCSPVKITDHKVTERCNTINKYTYPIETLKIGLLPPCENYKNCSSRYLIKLTEDSEGHLHEEVDYVPPGPLIKTCIFLV